MARLVHITSEAAARSIARGGIKAGKQTGVIYFMPLISGHYIAHQWSRELKRQGITCFAAVHFELPDDELVWYGRYNERHVHGPLTSAIRQFKQLGDQQGYEFFREGRIDKKQITKIRAIPRPLGWRHYPGAHGRKPCGCPACLRTGEYGSAERRVAWSEENEPRMGITQARQVIAKSSDVDQLCQAIWALGKKTRREDPSFLFHLFGLGDEIITYDILRTLGAFSHPAARGKLGEFLASSDLDLREIAEESLRKRGWL